MLESRVSWQMFIGLSVSESLIVLWNVKLLQYAVPQKAIKQFDKTLNKWENQ